MMKAVSVLLAACCLLTSAQSWAYRGPDISISIGVPAPPPPPPVVVVPAPAPPPPPPPPPPPVYQVPVVEYVYYPAWNVYWDPVSHQYWSYQYGSWVLGPLPPHIHPGRLGHYTYVPAQQGRPWHHMPHGYRPGW